MAVKLKFDELIINFEGDNTPPLNLTLEDGDLVAIIFSREFYHRALINFLHFIPDEYEGEASFLGKEFKTLTNEDREKWQKSFASVSLFYPLINNLKVIENVYLPVFYRDNIKEEIVFNKAYSILAELGIEKKFNQLPAFLSNFEKKLTIFARAKMLEPAIIYYGNVFSDLDEDKRNYFSAKIAELHNERSDRISIVTFRSENELNELNALKFNKIINM